MRTINFKEMKFFVGIDHKEQIIQDMRLDTANLLYRNSDIRGLELGQKIFKSEGPIDLEDEEFDLLYNLIYNHCTPQVIDTYKAIKDDTTSK